MGQMVGDLRERHRRILDEVERRGGRYAAAAALGVSYSTVYAAIERAKNDGDARFVDGGPRGGMRAIVGLDNALAPGFEAAAKARGLSVLALRQALLDTIASDGIYDAVLEGVDLAPYRRMDSLTGRKAQRKSA